jgi:hypothetical protein
MTPFIVLSQRLYSVRTAKLYNKKEILSIIEEYSWVSYDVTEVTGVNSKTKHSYQSESIVRFMY